MNENNEYRFQYVDRVCVTNKYSHFTYGKIYSVTLAVNLIEIVDDRGVRSIIDRAELRPLAHRGEVEFISLDEWRDKKLEQLGI